MCDQLEASSSVHVNRDNERTSHHRPVTDARSLSLFGKLSLDDNRTLVDKQMTIVAGLFWQLRVVRYGLSSSHPLFVSLDGHNTGDIHWIEKVCTELLSDHRSR